MHQFICESSPAGNTTDFYLVNIMMQRAVNENVAFYVGSLKDLDNSFNQFTKITVVLDKNRLMCGIQGSAEIS